jgi:pimeloyl-ACP methyl ester carboxylesterase
MTGKRKHAQDLRGASQLVVDATQRVADVVEAMHTTISSGPALLGQPLSLPMGALNSLVYGSVRGVTRLVGKGVETALAQWGPLLGESVPGPEREALLAVLNGVVGDHLVATGNPLAIPMRLRRGGRPLALTPKALKAAYPRAGGRLVVLVHGLCANDLQWSRNGHDHGAALEADLGFTPLYLHYNSGLHTSENGRALTGLLEDVVAHWPSRVQQLVLLGHSMGGLVVRSACAQAAGQRWRRALTHLFTLGTPHHGAPLELAGNWVGPLLSVSRYSAPLARLARLRSAGITDMRFGNVVDADWVGRDRFALGDDPRRVVPLPAGVACYAVAATISREGTPKPVSDGQVRVDSALGRHPEAKRVLGFPKAHQWVGHGMHHLDLLDRREVYERLTEWLARAPKARARA